MRLGLYGNVLYGTRVYETGIMGYMELGLYSYVRPGIYEVGDWVYMVLAYVGFRIHEVV